MSQNTTKQIELLLSRMAVALENISANSTAVTEATLPDAQAHAFIWQAQEMRFQPVVVKVNRIPLLVCSRALIFSRIS